MKDVAPSSDLRKWYGHQPERFAEFARRYRKELTKGATQEALEIIRSPSSAKAHRSCHSDKGSLEHSGAAVLQGPRRRLIKPQWPAEPDESCVPGARVMVQGVERMEQVRVTA